MDSLSRDESGTLISSRRVDGTAVYNPKGESLGSVDHLMIDKLSGQVAYAVMSFEGFLGIGEKYHPLPWSVLEYDVSKGGYVVDLDRRILENAPPYETPIRRSGPTAAGRGGWTTIMRPTSDKRTT